MYIEHAFDNIHVSILERDTEKVTVYSYLYYRYLGLEDFIIHIETV